METTHSKVPMLFSIVLKLFAILGMTSLGIVVYALYFEDPFVEYQNVPFPVQSPVEQGTTALITIERCNQTGSQRVYISSRTLKSVDTGKEVDLPESTVSMKPGCSKTTSRSIIIPSDTPPGKYIVKGEAVTEGLLKQHHVQWYTTPFQVIKAKPLSQKLQEEMEREARRQGF